MKKAILNMKAFYISLFVVLFFPLGLMGQEVRTFSEGDVIFIKDVNDIIMCVESNGEGDVVLSALPKGSFAMSAFWKVIKSGLVSKKSYFQNIVYGNYLKYDAKTGIYSVVETTDEATEIETRNSEWYLGTNTEKETVKIKINYQVKTVIAVDWRGNVTTWSEPSLVYKEFDHEYNHTFYLRPYYDGTKWVGNIATTDVNIEDFKSKLVSGKTGSWGRYKDDDTELVEPYSYSFVGSTPKKKVSGSVNTSTKAYRPIVNFIPNTEKQEVHEFREVIYAANHDSDVAESYNTVKLSLPVEGFTNSNLEEQLGDLFSKALSDLMQGKLELSELSSFVESSFFYLSGYYRWYDYKTGEEISQGEISHEGYESLIFSFPAMYFETKNDYGNIFLPKTNCGVTSYILPKDFGSKFDSSNKPVISDPIIIACDVSNYTDFNLSITSDGEMQISEPTLSYRVIYEIHDAQEMCNILDPTKNSNEYLETYNIIAPAGKEVMIGHKYAYSNYYTKTTSSSKIGRLAGTWNNNKNSGMKWSKDGVQINHSYISDRLISITAPTQGTTVEYTATYTPNNQSHSLKLAKFVVTGYNPSLVGPSATILQKENFYEADDRDNLEFDLKAELDFDDFYDPNSQNNPTMYPNPLPWEDISAGFVYPSLISSGNKQREPSFVAMSEYALLRTTGGYTKRGSTLPTIKNHGEDLQNEGKNTDEGYFLYVDATKKPSKVADLTINGDLCPNSKIYVSAWIANASNESSNYPNLNFVMMGVMTDATGNIISETQVATFTTGEVTTKGKWMHIMFEFATTNVEYDKYRIRIENNNAAVFGTGNDFAIDDIKIYMTSRTEASIIQNRSCPAWNPTNSDLNKSNVAILRADIVNVPDGDIYMSYTWLKQIGESADGNDVDVELLDLQNYIDVTANAVDPNKIFGKIKVNKSWIEKVPNNWSDDDVKKEVTIGSDKIVVYKNTEAFFADNDFSDDVKASGYFFTIEGEGDDARIVLYIVHKSSLFQQFEEYCSIVTPINLDNYISEYKTKYADSAPDDEDALEALYNELKCGTRSKFEVLPYASIMLSKDASNNYDFDFTQAVVKHLAEGQNYTFAVEAYYEGTETKDGKEVKVMKPYNCSADWLLVTNDGDKYKWEDAQKIITWRANGGTQPDLNKGNTLVKESVIPNYVVDPLFQVENFSGPLHYIAIPNPKVAVDGNTPCAIPVEIYLYDSIPATLANPEVSEVTDTWKYDRPAEICNEPIIVRIPNSLVKDNGNIALNLDIDYFDEYLFAEIAKYNEQEGNANLYPLNNIYLYDANGQSVKFNITTTAKDDNNQTLTLDLLNKDDDVTINKADGATLSFESGQKYHFAGHNQIGNVKITPPFQFDVYVVPDEVKWTGDEDKSTAWHKDANWNPAFIPMSHTNVVIPGNTVNKPVLNPAEGEFEAGAYKWLEHDIVLTKNEKNVLVDNTSATLNSCNDIYFAAGAQLANQHMLNYERAFVDVPFAGDNFGKSTANYKIMSFPLRNVYRGDLYIPKAGDGSFAFASPADVDNRAYNSFYVKAYNSAIQKNTISGDKTKPEAEKVVEVKDYTYESTEGWSNPTSVLNFEFKEAHGYAVSLNANTAQSFVRLPKSATEYYLFMNFGGRDEKELHGSTWPKYEISGRESGHKLVYDKEHGASVTFTFTNKHGNIFLIGNPFMTGLNVKKFLEGNTNLNPKVYYTYTDGTINVNVTPKETDEIPPFGAMFVQGKSTGIEQPFKFTPEMMSYTESSTSTQQRAPRMVEERELLTITAEVNGARSRTYIEKDFAANNEYFDTEDADLLVLDAALTPISVYSVATGAALAYNSVTDMEFVPLGLLLVDSTIVAESVRFTFDGVDYFYDELYLYDALYNSYLPLIDGVALELEMPESGELRYFVTDTKRNVGGGVATSDDLVEDTKVCIFTTDGEACIIADDIISEATVYDIAGRLIYYSDQIYSSQHNISLPNGVYMLKVVVNSNLSTHKIILK